MNKAERIEMVKAMDTIINCLNDEAFIEFWLTEGVADCDIEYGNAEDYTDDDTFADLMNLFVRIMRDASGDGIAGTLYCDGLINKPEGK